MKMSINLLKSTFAKNPKKLADCGIEVDDTPKADRNAKSELTDAPTPRGLVVDGKNQVTKRELTDDSWWLAEKNQGEVVCSNLVCLRRQETTKPPTNGGFEIGLVEYLFIASPL